MSDPARERYRHLRFLVIDDQPAARDGLRTCAQTMGAFSVEFCTAYKDAIARVRRAVPDVILCDYNLGERRSGQHLLEEMRRDRLLPEESVFIMVTAEKSYENVVATVELGPDDYIIKPFSPDRLRFRLDRALTRKQFFRPLYVAKREGDYATAEAFIAQHLASEEGKPYRFDLMRALAELQLARGEPMAAQAAYAEILELHPFPWARAGMARALLMQNRLQEARELVDGVVTEAPMYFDAFDLKAKICMEMGDHAEAQRTVEDASRRSTRNHARKRLLADVALRNGDAETARRAIAEVLEIDVLGDPPDAGTQSSRSRGYAGGRAGAAGHPGARTGDGQSGRQDQPPGAAGKTRSGRCARCIRRALCEPCEHRDRIGRQCGQRAHRVDAPGSRNCLCVGRASVPARQHPTGVRAVAVGVCRRRARA
jgi:DNA-binding response OmpR family regulator